MSAEGAHSHESACQNCAAMQHDDCSLFTDQNDSLSVVSCADVNSVQQCIPKNAYELPITDPNSPYYDGGANTNTNSNKKNSMNVDSNAMQKIKYAREHYLLNAIKTHKLLAGGIAVLTLGLFGVMIYYLIISKKNSKTNFGFRRHRNRF
jgi:hypothetical protein